MNTFLRPDRKLQQYGEFIAALNDQLFKISTTGDPIFIELSHIERGMSLNYGLRTVEFIQLPDDDDDFWLKLARGTKGSIESHYSTEELEEAVNVTLNWLVHQEYSIDDHFELTERLAKEARKYE